MESGAILPIEGVSRRAVTSNVPTEECESGYGIGLREKNVTTLLIALPSSQALPEPLSGAVSVPRNCALVIVNHVSWAVCGFYTFDRSVRKFLNVATPNLKYSL